MATVNEGSMFLLVLFMAFLAGLIILDIAMVVSLLRPGDERRQMVVWKASTCTLMGLVGSMIINIIEGFINNGVTMINPFIHLSVAATLYLGFTLYFKRKLGG